MMICLGTTPALQRTMEFERLVIDDVNRAARVTVYASGKPGNVARVLTTLGERAVLATFVGGDTGRAYVADLKRAGIEPALVETSAATRVCITVVDRGAGTATELIEEPGAVEPAGWDALVSKLQALLPQAKGLVLSGSLAPPQPAGFYATCVRLARTAGVRCVVDARGEPLRRAIAERPDVIKPNLAELADTVGRELQSESDIAEAIGETCRAGAGRVLVTRGSAGAIAGDGRQCWRIGVPKITPTSAIGSGDSVAAGLIAAMTRGIDLPEAAKLAMACGVANALTPHAGHVDAEEVRRLAGQITVEPM
jgi:1-phosphofructokinase family hexose kinase